MKKKLLSVNTGRIFANPFYCLGEIDPTITMKHEPLVSEEVWIDVGVKVIEEIGAERYLRYLLQNLKGNFVK